MEYGRVYSEKGKTPKKPMERIYAMLFFACMVLLVMIVSNNVENDKNKNIFYFNGERVNLLNEIEKEKTDSNSGNKSGEYIYYITMTDIRNIFDNNLIYEETKGQIITTNDTHVGMITIDSDIMNLNGSEVKLSKAPYENRVAVFSKSKKYEIFKLKSDEKLKSIPSLIGGDVTKVTSTENLVYLRKTIRIRKRDDR